MKVLIFRHGPAGDSESWTRAGKPDEQRPLTADGKIRTRKAAAGLAKTVEGLDLILTSPLTRAEQSADRLAQSFPGTPVRKAPELKPGSAPSAAIKRLAELKTDSAVALVGHEPHLSSLISQLCLGREGLGLELKKAGACLLEWDGREGAVLLWLLAPRQLRRLG